MKTLNIDSPTAQRLAQVALFERIQAVLNLDLREIVSDIKSYSRRRGLDPIKVTVELEDIAPKLIRSILNAVSICLSEKRHLSSREINWLLNDQVCREIAEHLQWYPARLLKGIYCKASEEHLDPAECAKCLAENSAAVVAHVFAKAREIIGQKS